MPEGDWNLELRVPAMVVLATSFGSAHAGEVGAQIGSIAPRGRSFEGAAFEEVSVFHLIRQPVLDFWHGPM